MSNLNPVEIENDDPIRMKLTGGRWWVIAIMSISIAYNIGAIRVVMQDRNKLKEDELKIQREQLDLARRQFTLDSIAAAKNEKIR